MMTVTDKVNSGSYDVDTTITPKGCEHDLEPDCESCTTYYGELLQLQNTKFKVLEQFKLDLFQELKLMERPAIRDKVFDLACRWASPSGKSLNDREVLTQVVDISRDVVDVVTVNASAFDQAFSSLTVPLLKASADMLVEYSSAITTGGFSKVGKLLESSAKVAAQLRDTASQMEVMQGRRGNSVGLGNAGELVGIMERIELLTWMSSLPALKPIAKCRTAEDNSLNLVIYYKSDIIQVDKVKVFKNAFEEFDTPPWLVQCLDKLATTFKQREWVMISNSQLMQAIGSILKGQLGIV